MVGKFFKHRPAVFSAVWLTCGIVCSRVIHVVGFWLVAEILLLLVATVLFRRSSWFCIVALSIAMVSLGMLLITTYMGPLLNGPIATLAELRPPQSIVYGTLTETSDTKTGQAWIIEVDSLSLASSRLSSSPIPIRGRVILFTQLDSVHLRPYVGGYYKIYCTLDRFHDASNPHEYAQDRAIQATRALQASGLVRSRYDCYLLKRPSQSLWSAANAALSGVHSSIVELLDTAISDRAARGFVKAVVLGERDDLDAQILDDFSTAGVAHILAVSGFNVAIVSLVILQLLRLIGLYRLRPRIIGTMLMVFAYCALVGFQPSVVRALFMIEMLLFARLIERARDPLNVFCAALTLNLLYRPSDLFDVGFQLSYSAVLGLVLIYPRLAQMCFKSSENEPVIETMWDKILSGGLITTAATLASLPVIASHFYRISFAGLFANIPIVPLSSLVTSMGFVLIPLTAIWIPLGQLYGEALSHVTHLLLLTTHLSARLPVAAHSAAQPSILAVICYVLIVIYTFSTTNWRHAVGRGTTGVFCLFTLWLLGAPLSRNILKPGKMQVLFFDVGQGDCIMIHTPNGKNYFVDFGTISRTNAARADRVMLPFLRAENENTVQAGFFSHMHRDHFGGAPTMLEHITFNHLYGSGERVRDPLASQLDSVASSRHIPCTTLHRGDRLVLDSDLVLNVLLPEREPLDEATKKSGHQMNEGSLVFKVVYRNTSILFLGDIERSDEEELLEDYGPFLASTVVKVAHHGSLTSSSREFVKCVDPKIAVISVGEHNTFGHPAPAIVKRWTSEGAELFRTDRDGAVLLESDGNTVTHTDWR